MTDPNARMLGMDIECRVNVPLSVVKCPKVLKSGSKVDC